MAFITAEELKSMPLPVTDKQWGLLDGLSSPYRVDFAIAAATQHVQNYLERDIESNTYIERIPGNGRATMMLNNYPVTSVTSVTGLDRFGYTRSYSGVDFLIDDYGILEWIDKYRNTFVKGWVYTVTYTAGYTVIPAVIKHATALQAINMLQPLFRGGTNFAQVDLIDSLDETTVDLLERYRRVRIG